MAEEKSRFFSRITSALTKTREKISAGLGRTFLGKKEIDDGLLEEVESLLLTADFGVQTSRLIVDELTRKVARKELADAPAVFEHLQTQLVHILEAVERPLEIPASDTPFVILMVGVNGAGKTTTIGKLAAKYMGEGKSVMLAAGDTYRAAAVEQLQIWGQRSNVPVVAQGAGADSASVIYDALAAAKARNIDVLLADTAGRLQSKKNLLDELGKIHRVLAKIDATAPQEVMLVLDAGTGQNAISQVTLFQEAVQVSGLTLAKLDGTAQGGVIFALANQLGLPIRFIGVGEQIDDLRPFNARQFVQALFENK